MSIGRHPRKHESAPRAAQLERLKAQRKSARESRPPARRPILHQGDFVAIGQLQPSPPTYVQLLAEIKRIAMGGVMPSPAVFDHARPATWPTADELCGQLGVSWEQLADEAGLRIKHVGKA